MNTALSEGGVVLAVWKVVPPRYEQPIIPTLPLEKG